MNLAVVTEAFADRTLVELLDWLGRAAPEITALELGSGGYAPTSHCDRGSLLADAAARRRWQSEIEGRGFRIAALNAWGNPLHPDPDLASRHDRELRETIRLSAELGVDRVVALAGCPGGGPGDEVPHFAGGGWLPYLENVFEWQLDERVLPYWSELADLAHREHGELLICLELHPGTCAYNVETFSRLAPIAPNLAANIDPSHFFWQSMDTGAVVEALRDRIGYAHAKDVVFHSDRLALNGLLDHRWPHRPEELPWTFATLGRGHDADWWRDFVDSLARAGVPTIAIEHEDPFVPPEDGVVEAAQLLARVGMSA